MAELTFKNKTQDRYVIIAMANASRAATLRNAVLDFTDDVAVASDGTAAALLMSRRGPPRLLITDLSLPTLDGFALVRQLREAAPKSQSAVIVLSAHESLRTAARDLADSLGIASVLRIDTDRPALRAAIASAFNGPADDAAPAPGTEELSGTPVERDARDDFLHDAVSSIARRFQLPIVGAYVKTNNQDRFVAYISMTNPENLFTGSTAWSTLPQVAASGEPLVVPDVEGHPIFDGGAAAAAPIRGFASIPFISPQGNSLGALCVIDTRPLTLDAVALDALAAQSRKWAAAWSERFEVAPPSPTTFQVLEHLAATDPLTGLANRRGCETSIASEISRAKRELKPLSCILIDIDRFKLVNDTHGHPAGDQVLRDLSAIMRRSVRAYDILSRWGGEEFLLVLPGADAGAARALAERIRVAVEALKTAVGGVTISAGIATFDDDYDFEATIRLADRRLYQAKAAGRNCVI